jgi:phosphoserine phosphatase RsbU/P
MTDTWYLRVIPPEGEPFTFRAISESIVIGRSSSADLAVQDRAMSRRHARIHRNASSWTVEDLDSRNGIYLNGEKICGATAISAGDVLEMGTARFQLRDTSEAEPPEKSLLRPASEFLDQSPSTPPPADTAGGAALRSYAERLAILNDVHQALAQSVSLHDLLEMILERVCLYLRPGRAAIYLGNETAGFRRAAQRVSAGAAGDFKLPRSLAAEVAGKGMAALVEDTLSDERFARAESIQSEGIRSLLAAPLLAQEKSLGLIVLCSPAAVRQFEEADLALLVSLASVAALRLRNTMLFAEAEERRRLQHELSMARRIQVALLPRSLPEIEGYQVYGDNIPSRGVSGDYYEVVERPDREECVFCVADVSGKGMAGALVMSALEALSAAPLEAGRSPGEIFERVSSLLHRRTPPERYATAFLGVLHRPSGRFRYANAGHVPALAIRRDAAVAWLHSTGIPLGLMEDSRYEEGEILLKSEDAVVVYTDGVTEAENGAGQQFGRDRLAELCRRFRGHAPAALGEALRRNVEEFAGDVPIEDDRTLLIVRRL